MTELIDEAGWADSLQCSFCGKTKAQVAKIIAGPGVYICNECVDLCDEIIREEGIPCELDNRFQAGLTGILEIKGFVVTSHEVRARLLLAKHQKKMAEIVQAV